MPAPKGSVNNPGGKNQYPECVQATDERLRTALFEYSRLGITNTKIIQQYLAREYGINMSTKTIQRRNRELGIYAARGMKHRIPDHVQTQLVLDAVAKDPSGRKGPRTIKREILFENRVPITREFVDEVMHEFCPEGYHRRHPLHAKTVRTPLTSLGPNDEWSADGHDKLMKLGIAVYGFRDKATGYWLSLRIVPNNRLNVVITYLYLSLVEEKGGMPLQSTTDCGSETTGSFALANILRNFFCPDITDDDIPAHRFLRSVHNIVIERGWLRLRSMWGDNVYIEYMKGVEAGIYDENNWVHCVLGRWLWSTILSHEIEDVRIKMNHAPVRKDVAKLLPSGKGATPDHVYSFPEDYGLKDQLIPVDCDLIRELKLQLGGDSLLEFVHPEFSTLALGVYENLGSPRVSTYNAWETFTRMLPQVTEILADMEHTRVSEILSCNIPTGHT